MKLKEKRHSSQRSYGRLPVATTVQLIGSKWKLLSLRELEEDGIVIRTAFREVPSQMECSLSAPGGTMSIVLDTMQRWARITKRT